MTKTDTLQQKLKGQRESTYQKGQNKQMRPSGQQKSKVGKDVKVIEKESEKKADVCILLSKRRKLYEKLLSFGF